MCFRRVAARLRHSHACLIVRPSNGASGTMRILRTVGTEKALPPLMIWLRPLFVVALLFLPGVVSALDITAWKGETVNAFLPDGENVAEARDGFVVKVGALKGVDYNQAPVIWRKVMSNALDRVAWGDPAATSRVVQVRVPRDAKPGVHAFGDLRVKVLDRFSVEEIYRHWQAIL